MENQYWLVLESSMRQLSKILQKLRQTKCPVLGVNFGISFAAKSFVRSNKKVAFVHYGTSRKRQNNSASQSFRRNSRIFWSNFLYCENGSRILNSLGLFRNSARIYCLSRQFVEEKYSKVIKVCDLERYYTFSERRSIGNWSGGVILSGDRHVREDILFIFLLPVMRNRIPLEAWLNKLAANVIEKNDFDSKRARILVI